MIFSFSAGSEQVIVFDAGEDVDGGVPGGEDEEHGDEDQGDGDQLEDGGDHDDAEDPAHQPAGDHQAVDDEPGQHEPTHFLTESFLGI